MKKCIAIGGIPGTGKSTLMKKYMLNKNLEFKELRKLVSGHVNENLVILGDYSNLEHVFPGSDRFSMAVQPEAETFFLENNKNVVFEGDRIFNNKMLSFIRDNGYDLLIIILEANDKLLQDRYDLRGSDQSDKFISGRKTKYENIKNDSKLNVFIAIHETPKNTNDIVDAINFYLNTGKINPNVLKQIEHSTLDDFFS